MHHLRYPKEDCIMEHKRLQQSKKEENPEKKSEQGKTISPNAIGN